MRCDWQECGNRVNGVGDVECPRCGRVIYGTPNTAEEIRGDYSCMTWPRWWEVGSWLSYGLALVGIRKEAWEQIVGKCGCPQRERNLNRLGLSTLTNLSSAYHATSGLTIF